MELPPHLRVGKDPAEHVNLDEEPLRKVEGGTFFSAVEYFQVECFQGENGSAVSVLHRCICTCISGNVQQ